MAIILMSPTTVNVALIIFGFLALILSAIDVIFVKGKVTLVGILLLIVGVLIIIFSIIKMCQDKQEALAAFVDKTNMQNQLKSITASNAVLSKKLDSAATNQKELAESLYKKFKIYVDSNNVPKYDTYNTYFNKVEKVEIGRRQ